MSSSKRTVDCSAVLGDNFYGSKQEADDCGDVINAVFLCFQLMLNPRKLNGLPPPPSVEIAENTFFSQEPFGMGSPKITWKRLLLAKSLSSLMKTTQQHKNTSTRAKKICDNCVFGI